MKKIWLRQHVTSSGRVKVKYQTEYAALKVCPKNHYLKWNVYRCEVCQYYHVGRQPRRLYYDYDTDFFQQKVDEAMVGRLISALRAVLDRDRASPAITLFEEPAKCHAIMIKRLISLIRRKGWLR